MTDLLHIRLNVQYTATCNAVYQPLTVHNRDAPSLGHGGFYAAPGLQILNVIVEFFGSHHKVSGVMANKIASVFHSHALCENPNLFTPAPIETWNEDRQDEVSDSKSYLVMVAAYWRQR